MNAVPDHIDGPVLSGDRIALRAPRRRDTDVLTAFLATERGRGMGHGPQSDAEARWRTAALVTGHWILRGYGLFVIEADGAPIGHAGPHYPDGWPERELAWGIWSDAHEGKGYAAEAAIVARDHLFGDLGWPTLVSYIDPANTRSVALARRLGAVEDPAAPRRHPDDLVFRHPVQEAA